MYKQKFKKGTLAKNRRHSGTAAAERDYVMKRRTESDQFELRTVCELMSLMC